MNYSYTIEIDAPCDRVFPWLTDSQLTMKWIPKIIEHEDLEVTTDHIGSTFRQVYSENGRPMEFWGKVLEYEQDRRSAVYLSGDSFDLYIEYQLEDLGGRTQLTQHTEIRFKGFVKILVLLMKPFIRKSALKEQKKTFESLKELVEADTGEVD